MAAHSSTYLFFCLCLPSVCDEETLLQSRSLSAEERVGSTSFVLQNVKFSYVILQFNINLQGNWMVYTEIYDKHNLGKGAVCISG